MEAKDKKFRILNFKDYYNSLDTDEKIALRQLMVPAYMSYPTFYAKLDKNTWTALEIEKLEMLTGDKFTGNGTTQY